MPNKKGRNKNLPPLEFDLPTPSAPKFKSKKRKRNIEDDTPKAFTRLLSRVQKGKHAPRGLDDPPLPAPKKQKQQGTLELKIQPSETLKQFNRRVDASMPVKLKADPPLKKKQAKAKAALKKVKDDDDGDNDEEDRKRRRGRNKGRATSPDPWAALAAKRETVRFSDVAKAPPTLVKPRSVLHSRGIVDVEGVPKSVGSLAKREGLVGERRGVVEGYRKLMEERRGKGLLVGGP